MKMMVPTLQAKEVTAKEYVAHWSVALDHAQVLCDRQIQVDSISAELKTHYIAMLHQLNSIRDGFVSTGHADLLERDAEDKLADAAAADDRLWAERMAGLGDSQAIKANRIISDLESFLGTFDVKPIAKDIKELAHPVYPTPSVKHVGEALAMEHEQAKFEEPMDVFKEVNTNLEMKK